MRAVTGYDTAKRRIDGAQVFATVWQAHRTLLAKGEESVRATGLGDSDFHVLRALFFEGALPVNVIGDKVNLTTGSITSAIDRVEAKSLVMRRPHPTDRRVRLVELTTKGQRLIERANVQHTADMDRAIKCLSKDDRATLVRLLNRLQRHS